MSFLPFRLVERKTLTSPGAECPVVLLSFALPPLPDGSPATLGLSQPTTHVKIRVPGSWFRARTFSIVSPADLPGVFSVAAKVHSDGRLTPWLASIPLGTAVSVTHTLTKRLASPLDNAPGHRLVLVSFGIGIAELVETARRAVHGGQQVAVVAAFRTSADVVFLRELCNVSLEAGHYGASLTLHILLSREEPSEALRACVASTRVVSGFELRRGRVDRASLERLLTHASEECRGGPSAGNDWAHAAALAVGSKAQAREAYALLEGMGVTRKLLGRPIVWGCW